MKEKGRLSLLACVPGDPTKKSCLSFLGNQISQNILVEKTGDELGFNHHF